MIVTSQYYKIKWQLLKIKAFCVTEKFMLVRKNEAALLKKKGRHRHTYRTAVIHYLSHLVTNLLSGLLQDCTDIGNSFLFTFTWDFFLGIEEIQSCM